MKIVTNYRIRKKIKVIGRFCKKKNHSRIVNFLIINGYICYLLDTRFNGLSILVTGGMKGSMENDLLSIL